jgi:hypothetical protein
MSLTLDSILVATRDHLASDLPDETIVLNLPRGRYFGVNGVARDVWRMLQEPTSVRAIRDAISERYGKTSDEVERDLYPFLDELRSNALITVSA